MYTIERKDGFVEVKDSDGKIVYKASTDSFMIYKQQDLIQVARIKELKDENLLIALATAVKLPA
jgi:hypothetical protein